MEKIAFAMIALSISQAAWACNVFDGKWKGSCTWPATGAVDNGVRETLTQVGCEYVSNSKLFLVPIGGMATVTLTEAKPTAKTSTYTVTAEFNEETSSLLLLSTQLTQKRKGSGNNISLVEGAATIYTKDGEKLRAKYSSATTGEVEKTCLYEKDQNG